MRTFSTLCAMLITTTARRSIPSTLAFQVDSFAGKQLGANATPFRHQSARTSTRLFSTPNLPELGGGSKRLFLIRHGEVINPGASEGKSVYYGAMDVSLSPLGKQEAQAAAGYLSSACPSLALVACSPLSRAVYGAEQVLAEIQGGDSALLQDDLFVLDGFKELDRGAWCGKTKGEIGPDNLARFDSCDESVTPEGGESYPQLKSRVIAARDEVLARLPDGQAAAIVSHLQVTRCMLSNAMGIPTEEMSQLPVGTASVTCIDYNGADDNQTVHFQSFKPEVGLAQSADGAN